MLIRAYLLTARVFGWLVLQSRDDVRDPGVAVMLAGESDVPVTGQLRDALDTQVSGGALRLVSRGHHRRSCGARRPQGDVARCG